MSKVKNANVDSKKLSTLNLSALSKNLKERVVSEKNQKSLLYNYPEKWTSVNINGGEGKSFRGKIRTQLQNFADNIYISVKQNNSEKLFSEIKNFKVWYKTNFKLNDFSLNSLTHQKDNFSISEMLEIIKKVESNTTAPKKEKKAKKSVKTAIAAKKEVAPIATEKENEIN
jgi:hypothetical protein